MSAIKLTPGSMGLANWRAIYRGSIVEMDAGARKAVDAGAQAVQDLIASGRAVYGVNTGFGKLATVRISDEDLGELQTRLVLSHAAGVGDAVPAHIVRLMMALKMSSLGRGVSGVRW